MPRALFEKTGSAIWISHLDLMRLFQRAFKRAGLSLKHSQGFNPRPSVSIALPLSVGVESRCELLDFELEGECVPNHVILEGLNRSLVEGVRVLDVYDEAAKIRHLALLRCCVELEYDAGIPAGAVAELTALFAREDVTVEKKGKNGITEQNIIPMIKSMTVISRDSHTLAMEALICCQNPTLNPMQLAAAVDKYLPHLHPDFTKCARIEVYNADETIFR